MFISKRRYQEDLKMAENKGREDAYCEFRHQEDLRSVQGQINTMNRTLETLVDHINKNNPENPIQIPQTGLLI